MQRTFRCRVIYNGESLGSGVASKKKKAEAAAAKDAYERLSVHYTPVD